MNFSEKYKLENERVLLKPLELSDFENLKHFVMLEPELWHYSLVQPNTESKMKQYIETAISNRENYKEYAFIVFDKKTKKYAGCTRYYDIQLEAKTLQLGYTWYGKHFQGTGLNKNCKYLLLEFAFDTLGMERVEFRADNDNKKSIAAMHSIGCITEGVLRNHGFKADGTRRDSIVLSILKNEWESTVKQNLASKILSSSTNFFH